MAENDAPYIGPIEHIKPGDILSWERFDEYREFMKKHKNIPNIKLWGLTEKWEDNHQRPFHLPDKPEPKEEPNPFD